MIISLKNDSILAEFDLESGVFTSLKGLAGETRHEYLLIREQFPQFDGADSRWLGSVRLQTVQNGCVLDWNTSDLDESRNVVHKGNAVTVSYPNGAAGGVSLTERFALEPGNGGIFWDLSLENEGAAEIEVRRLGLPLMMDQYFRNDSQFKYEKNVMRHTCVSHNSSVIYWSHSSGQMPLLLFQTIDNTALTAFDTDTSGKFGHYSTFGEAFEGCFNVYLYHEPIATSHIPCETLILQPGERRQFHFRFSVCGSIEDMVDDIERQGNLAVKLLPGMVAPIGDALTMLVRCKYPVAVHAIGGVTGEAEQHVQADSVVPRDSIDSLNQRYCITLHSCGIREFHLTYQPEDGICRTVKIQMFGTEPLADMISDHARFIAEKQFESDESDPCYHGLLMWDMITARRVNSTHNPHGADWMRGGSDEIGLVSGLFLSEKNLYQPDEGQIRVLDSYVKDFIEERLTEQPGYRVHRMVPWYKMFDDNTGAGADDVWRAFNYVHVINTYYNMYRIASLYQFDFLSSPKHYILQAYHYTKAMFSFWMFPDGVGAAEYGNMGEMTLPLYLADTLRKEGFSQEANDIDEIVRKKADCFLQRLYPFGSEMAYDTTAYEAVYAYGKAGKYPRVMSAAVRAALGNRGRQPVWYLYQTDVRGGGDTHWNDSYMTQLAAWTFYDWMFEEGHVTQELVEAWYAAYLAGWALYNSGGCWDHREENRGASGWIITGAMGHFSGIIQTPWQKDPYRYGCVACSGESALGYYAALKVAASVVYAHSAAGMYGFGCDVQETENGTTVIPKDGVRRRIYHIPQDWAVRIDRDQLSRVCRAKDGTFTLELKNWTGDAHETTLLLRQNGGQWVTRKIQMKPAEKQVVIIRRQETL